jgi:hypothetical protein
MPAVKLLNETKAGIVANLWILLSRTAANAAAAAAANVTELGVLGARFFAV